MIRFEQAVRGDLEADTPVWRYFAHDKFRALVETSAVWFSKLSRFQDAFEGHDPSIARLADMKMIPDDGTRGSRDRPVPLFTLPEEVSGRELTVASCWFEGATDDRDMWTRYAGVDGLAVRSSAVRLLESMQLQPSYSRIGRIEYRRIGERRSDDERELLFTNDRAFIKDSRFSSEREVRVTTLNLVAPGCLNHDGTPPNDRQRAGLTYSENRPGILVRANLERLIDEVRVAGDASPGYEEEVTLWLGALGKQVRVVRSECKAAAADETSGRRLVTDGY